MYHEDSGLSKVGIGRFIVIKSNPIRDDKSKYAVQVLGSETFSFGFACPKEQDYVSRDWLSEDLFLIEDDIHSLLEDEPNGFYEIMGDIYYYGWRSYEGEYDCEGELRNATYQKITYDQAKYFDDNEILQESTVELMGEAHGNNTCVNPYMERIQILRHYSNALADLLRSYGSGWIYNKDMTDKQLQDYIFMATLEIDSTELEHPQRAARAKEIHPLVDEVLNHHEELMTNERTDQNNKLA